MASLDGIYATTLQRLEHNIDFNSPRTKALKGHFSGHAMGVLKLNVNDKTISIVRSSVDNADSLEPDIGNAL